MNWTPALAAALLVAAIAPIEASESPTASDLVGQWRADLEHAGTRSTMDFEFAQGDAEGLLGRLTLAAIDLEDLNLGSIKIDRSRLQVGPFEMSWDAERQRLRGTLPEAFVPVVSIPFELRRRLEQETPAPEPEPGPPAALHSPVWSRDLGAEVWAGLSVANDILLVGADDGAVSALATTDGELRWRFETGGRIRARPTITDDLALVSSDDGFLYAIALDDGSEAWRARLGPPSARIGLSESGSRYEHYASSPTVRADRIYVANGAGELLCLRLEGGSVVWRFQAGDSITSTPALAGGKVLVASFDNHVYAVDAATGAQVWRHDTGAAVPASPVVAGGLVLVGGRSYELEALDLETGERVWSRYFWFSWVEADPTLADGTVYVGLSDGQKVFALGAALGTESWSFDTGGSVWAPPALAGSSLIIGAVGVPGYIVDHRAGLFAVDRHSGREIWRHEQPAPADGGPAYGFAAAPAAAGGRVFAATIDGRVLAFEVAGSS